MSQKSRPTPNVRTKDAVYPKVPETPIKREEAEESQGISATMWLFIFRFWTIWQVFSILAAGPSPAAVGKGVNKKPQRKSPNDDGKKKKDKKKK